MKQIIAILERNGFEVDPLDDTRYFNEKCYIDIERNFYKVTHSDDDFLEGLSWFSNDLNIYSLMGYLSWNDFIERGYNK